MVKSSNTRYRALLRNFIPETPKIAALTKLQPGFSAQCWADFHFSAGASLTTSITLASSNQSGSQYSRHCQHSMRIGDEPCDSIGLALRNFIPETSEIAAKCAIGEITAGIEPQLQTVASVTEY